MFGSILVVLFMFAWFPQEGRSMTSGKARSMPMSPDVNRTKRTAIRNTVTLWSNGVIPYILDSSITSKSDEVTKLNAAFDAFKNRTCVRFVPRTSETDYIKIYSQYWDECWANFGKVGGEQQVVISSGAGIGLAIHPLAHVLGFIHEEQRFDRDQFVTIDFNNPYMWTPSYYDLIPASAVYGKSTKTAYDYTSVMHSNSFSDIILPKDTAFKSVIGQRDGFGKCDASKINYMYSCIDGEKLRECFQSGFCINS